MVEKADWIEYRGFLVSAKPPQLQGELSEEEVSELFRLFPSARFIRTISEFDRTKDSPFWYVIQDKTPYLQDYSSNTRSKVKRGLKRHRIFEADKAFMLDHAYPVYAAAHERYGDANALSEMEFKKHLESLDDRQWWCAENIEAKKLAAYCQNQLVDNSLHMMAIKFDPSMLKDYPSYALFHHLGEHYLGQKEVKYISDGARSLDHDTRVQELLMDKFGYRKAFCRLNIYYRSPLGLMVRLLAPFKSILPKGAKSLILQHQVALQSH